MHLIMLKDKENNMSEILHAVINKILSIQNLKCIAPGLYSSMLISYHGFLL